MAKTTPRQKQRLRKALGGAAKHRKLKKKLGVKPRKPKYAAKAQAAAKERKVIRKVAKMVGGKTPAQRNRELSILGGSDYGQFYRPPPLIEKPTFGMRLRSGLGALGRGIGNMAMMFNPYSAALGLAGKARLGSMFNIGSRYANQGGNFLNEWRQYDNLMDYLNRNKNQTTERMDPKLAKYFSGTEGIMDRDSRPEYEIDDSWYLS